MKTFKELWESNPAQIMAWMETATDEDLRNCLTNFSSNRRIYQRAKALLEERRHGELKVAHAHWTFTPTFWITAPDPDNHGAGLAVPAGAGERKTSNFSTLEFKSCHFNRYCHAAYKCSRTTSNVTSCRTNVATCSFRGTETRSVDMRMNLNPLTSQCTVKFPLRFPGVCRACVEARS